MNLLDCVCNSVFFGLIQLGLGCALLGFIISVPLMLINPVAVIIPRVENSTLYSLDFDASTSTVTYNVSAVFSFFYPNLIGLRFNLVATPVYHGQKLGQGGADPPSFRMRKGMTMQVHMDVQGQQVVGDKRATAVATAYRDEIGRGYFKIDGRVQVDEGANTRYFVCTLYYPLPTAWPGGAPNLFDGVECIDAKPYNDDNINPFQDY